MLNFTERAGNALPHPATLFALFALSTLILSAIGSLLGWEAIHPGTKQIVSPINLLSHDGIHRILLEMVDNFTGFAPLGIVLVAMLGIGIAEQSGLIHALIRLLVLKSPQHLLTFVLVFAGILSNVCIRCRICFTYSTCRCNIYCCWQTSNSWYGSSFCWCLRWVQCKFNFRNS